MCHVIVGITRLSMRDSQPDRSDAERSTSRLQLPMLSWLVMLGWCLVAICAGGRGSGSRRW